MKRSVRRLKKPDEQPQHCVLGDSPECDAEFVNRYLDLLPVMTGHAQKFGLAMAPIRDDGDMKLGTALSTWVLFSLKPSALQIGDLDKKRLLVPKSMLHWTDARSNLLSVWGAN